MLYPSTNSSTSHCNGGGYSIGLWIGGFILVSGLQIGCVTADKWGTTQTMPRPFQSQAHEGDILRVNSLGQVSSLSAHPEGLRQQPSTPQWVTRLLEDPSAP